MYVCMYVCIEVALHGIAHGIRRLTGPGVRLINEVGPMSQPRGIIDTASLTLDRTCALVYAFWANFNLGS